MSLLLELGSNLFDAVVCAVANIDQAVPRQAHAVHGVGELRRLRVVHGQLLVARRLAVKILHQKHHGPGAARNLGVTHAKGEIIVLADADMKFDKKYI